ncbi:MAG: hypothetical protein SGILL_003925 [Bacillariaceae sp.]
MDRRAFSETTYNTVRARAEDAAATAAASSPVKKRKWVVDLENSGCAMDAKALSTHGTPSKLIHQTDQGPELEPYYAGQDGALDTLVMNRVNAATDLQNQIREAELGRDNGFLAMRRDHDRQVLDLHEAQDREVAALKNIISDLQAQAAAAMKSLSALEAKRKQEIATLQANQDQAINDMKTAYDEQLDVLNAQVESLTQA